MNTECSSGFVCPLTGFRFFLNKSFLIGAAVMIVWANLFSWFWHGSYMAEAYQATANLWRGPDQMITSALNGGISLLAFVATYIFMKGYEGTGWREGLRFGVIVTLFFVGLGLVTYATQPIPQNIIVMWSIGDFIMYSVGGIILSYLFKANGCCNK